MSSSVENTGNTFDCRVAFAEELTRLARIDKRVLAVCNDSVGSSNLGAFRTEFPDRVINVGIAEQNMVGVAAGLANSGYVPYVCAASPFLTGRATEQVKADAAYSNYPLVLCGMSPGMAYGELGPTHHSIEDLPWMRAISDLTILVPADPVQTRSAVRWALDAARPIFMRVGRHKVPAVTPDGMDFEPGKIMQIRDGKDVTIVATGTMVSRAILAAETLAAKCISARVLNVITIKPLDTDTIIKAARETRGIVTVEEGIIYGGLGAAVAECVSQNHPVRMKILGVDTFAPTGSAEFLLSHFGLTADGIVNAATNLIG